MFIIKFEVTTNPSYLLLEKGEFPKLYSQPNTSIFKSPLIISGIEHTLPKGWKKWMGVRKGLFGVVFGVLFDVVLGLFLRCSAVIVIAFCGCV